MNATGLQCSANINPFTLPNDSFDRCGLKLLAQDHTANREESRFHVLGVLHWSLCT